MHKPTITKLCDVKKTKPEFYLENFLPIPKSAITLLSANGGSGKTFLAIQTALQLVKNMKKAKVLLWLSEDDKGIVKYRTELIIKSILDNSYTDINIDIIDDMPEHLEPQNKDIYKDIFAPYNLIIIDPLIAFYGGDENSNTQARFFMNMLNDIARKNIQSVLIIHHSTKPSKDKEVNTRGAGAFVDACRLAYEITSIEDETSIKRVNITKDNYGVKQLINADFKDIKILPYDSNFVKIEYENNCNEVLDKNGVPYSKTNKARSVMEFI